jgi:lipid-A-disaccharide synthase
MARAALAASGTVTLELALSGVPTVAAYRLPAHEELILRMMGIAKRLTSVILANLVIGENVVPEFLQRQCKPDLLADALLGLLADSPQRQRQIQAFRRLDAIMGVGGAAPSDRAATAVLEIAARGRAGAAAAAASVRQ